MPNSNNVKITEVTEPSEIILESLNRLYPQLSSSFIRLSMNELKEIISSNETSLFIAIDSSSENQIVGSLALVIFRTPIGLNIRIEDVVVDKTVRGKGIGKKLMVHAIQFAKKNGAKRIDLTSNPARISANHLYKTLGFKLKNTNVYRLII